MDVTNDVRELYIPRRVSAAPAQRHDMVNAGIFPFHVLSAYLADRLVAFVNLVKINLLDSLVHLTAESSVLMKAAQRPIVGSPFLIRRLDFFAMTQVVLAVVGLPISEIVTVVRRLSSISTIATFRPVAIGTDLVKVEGV